MEKEKNYSKGEYYRMVEEGGGHIFYINFHYILFEVPQYGGEEQFIGCYKTLEEAKKIVDSWT